MIGMPTHSTAQPALTASFIMAATAFSYWVRQPGVSNA